MTFEEFFKKKRIDLAALDKAEPALFSEFRTHFEQMGEKSFDHTKKYWFNKLRRLYQLAPEVKTERPIIENQLAEQTVTESLTEATPPAPSPKVDFVPRFKAANIAKPPVEQVKKEEAKSDPAEQSPDTPKPEESVTPKPAYKPRFNMKNIPPKANEEN